MKDDPKKQSEEKITEEASQAVNGDEINEYREKYLRALADYQNLERQTQNWKADFVMYANVDLVKKLLEVVDDLEKAGEHIADEGLQLIVQKLKNILRNEGLEELELSGKEYNPNEAEVVSTEKGEKDGMVVKILQKGYKIKERIIRPAKVIVSIKKEDSNL